MEEQHALTRREKELAMKRSEAARSPVISHHQPAQITSQFENMQRMNMMHQQQHRMERFLPYNFPSPHEHPAHRPGSPPRGDLIRDPRDLREMYPQHVKGIDRSPHGLVSPHPAHPFAVRTPEPSSHEYHRLAQQSGRPHLHPAHLAISEATYMRAHGGSRPGIDSTPGDRLSAIERSPNEPPVSGSLAQTQLHAHHHTHTHLHLHDELKYRNSVNGGATADPSSTAAPTPTHPDRHEHGHPTVMSHTAPILPPTHRPSSRSSGRDQLYEYPTHKSFQNEAALNQARIREMSRHGHQHNSREAPHPPLTPVGRDGAASPSFLPHDHDPVAYHQSILSRKYPHAGRHGHGQAPDLSPRGLPSSIRQNPADYSREAAEKLFYEKMSSPSPHMELRAVEHARAMREREHRILMERERVIAGGPPSDMMKATELLMAERSAQYGREDSHSSPYAYEAALRRMHDGPRSLYDVPRGVPEHLLMTPQGRERDRIEQRERERERMARSSVAFGVEQRALNERALQERQHHASYMRHHQQEKPPPHARSPMLEQHPMERVPHERPGYFFKPPETIDLSEE